MKPSPAVVAHAIFAAAVLSTAFAFGSGAGPGDDHDHDHPHGDHDHHKVTGVDLLGSEDMDQAQAMQNWMATMQPSMGHEVLKRFEGTWDTTTSMWMDPSAPPMISSGSSVNEMMYGGRFVKSTFSGLFMGQPFEGTSIMGFDNIRKQFTTIWFDSMSTAFSPSQGMLDPTGDVITMIGTMDEPMTGQYGKHYKQVITFQDDDNYTFEMIEILYGEEFPAVKIEYTRAD